MPCELSRSPHSGQHSSSHKKVRRSASGLRLLGRRPTVTGSPPGEMLQLCTMIDCCVNYTRRERDLRNTVVTQTTGLASGILHSMVNGENQQMAEIAEGVYTGL